MVKCCLDSNTAHTYSEYFERTFTIIAKGKPKKKIGCLIIFIIVLALIIGLVVYLLNMAKHGIAMKNLPPYGEVAVKDLTKYVNVSGTVSSSDSVNVTADVLQKVSKLNVKVGDSVKKGDVLCELDTTSLQEKYNKLAASAGKAQDAETYKSSILRRNLAEARNNKTNMLNKAQSAIDSAISARDSAYDRYNLAVSQYNDLIAQINAAEDETAAEALQEQADALKEMMDALYPKLPEFDSAIDAARSAYSDAEQSADSLIQTAQDAIDAEQYTTGNDSVDDDLKELQEQIDACTILAPADGVVTQLNVSEGSIPMSSNLMMIENTSSLIIRGKVGEADILRISEGMPCEIKTTATDDAVIEGSVKRIERIISSGSDAALSGYTVEISIDDPKSKLLIGMSASAKIILNKADQVLCIPYDAVRGGENEGYFVFALEETDKPNMVKIVRKDIEIGFEGDYFTEVTKGDLKEGDIVFTDFFSESFTYEDGKIIPDPRLTGDTNTANGAN